MEDSALELQLPSKLAIVDETAVMRKGNSTLDMVDEHRLGIESVFCTARTVTHVAERHLTFSERF